MKVKEFISSILGDRRKLSIAVIVIIAAALPLTVFVAQKQQELRQRAAGQQTAFFFSTASNCSTNTTTSSLPAGQTSTLYLCLNSNNVGVSAVNGFDVTIAKGTGIIFSSIADSVDAVKLNSSVASKVNTDGTIRFSKVDNTGVFIQGTALSLGKITFTTATTGAGSISVTKAQVVSSVTTTALTVAQPVMSYSIGTTATNGCTRTGTTISVSSACLFVDAVALAQSGDTLTITSGSNPISADVTIAKNLIIQGASRTTSILYGTTPANILTSGTVSFSNMTIGPKITIVSTGAGTGTNITVQNNDILFDGAGSRATALLMATSGLTATITGNKITGSGPTGISGSNNDANLTISNNNISGTFTHGISIGTANSGTVNTNSFTIQGNQVNIGKSTNPGAGILLSAFSKATIKSNALTGNSVGILADNGTVIPNIDTFPDGNTFTSNTINCKNLSPAATSPFPINEATAKIKCPDSGTTIPTATPIPTSSPNPVCATFSANPNPAVSGATNITYACTNASNCALYNITALGHTDPTNQLTTGPSKTSFPVTGLTISPANFQLECNSLSSPDGSPELIKNLLVPVSSFAATPTPSTAPGDLTVQGTHFIDTDRDGVFDSSEQPLRQVVQMRRTPGTPLIESFSSNTEGYYTYTSKDSGTFEIHSSNPSGYIPTNSECDNCEFDSRISASIPPGKTINFGWTLIPDCDSGSSCTTCLSNQSNTCNGSGAQTCTFTTKAGSSTCNRVSSLVTCTTAPPNCSSGYTCSTTTPKVCQINPIATPTPTTSVPTATPTPTTVPTSTPEPGVTPTTCTDGTPVNTCKTGNPPIYCPATGGSTINNCHTCGCPSGQTCNTSTGACAVPIATSTPTQAPTATPIAGNTIIALKIGLDSIGSVGDATRPGDASASTKNPVHTSRSVMVAIYNGTETLVSGHEGTVTYNATTGIYTGNVDLKQTPSGNYIVKLKIRGYLQKRIPGITSLVAGQTYNAPQANMAVGDLNSDNQLNIADYNILNDCIFAPSSTGGTICSQNPDYAGMSDLNDDGIKNILDYSLFVRELVVKFGD
ncbi:MAG: SdrD B-like domain-containing protein [Patescibacteria group bacterium]